MRRWQSHKIVEAEKIVGMESTSNGILLHLADGTKRPVSFTWNDKHEPHVGGYLVEYPDSDGYLSFSPGDVFERGNTEIH